MNGFEKNFEKKEDDDMIIDDYPESKGETLSWIKPKRRLIVDEADTEIVFYFSPADYELAESEEVINDVVRSLSWYGRFTGVDLSKFWRGEIRVFFNPVYHSEETKDAVVADIVNGIRSMPRR